MADISAFDKESAKANPAVPFAVTAVVGNFVRSAPTGARPLISDAGWEEITGRKQTRFPVSPSCSTSHVLWKNAGNADFSTLAQNWYMVGKLSRYCLSIRSPVRRIKS